MNPHWPYLPELKERYNSEEEKDVIEGTWSNIPDDPLNYHFYYYVLEGDECGRPPKIQDSKQQKEIINEHFNNNSTSCLSAIAKSQNRVSVSCICYMVFNFTYVFNIVNVCTDCRLADRF